MASSGGTRKPTRPGDWEPGDIILGLYEVLRVVGQGGMGKVYKVRHRGWGTDLAVKSPKPEDFTNPRKAEAFERECEMWVKLGLHPNIASCYYIRRIGGIPVVFAEYVGGGSLWRWIQRKWAYWGGTRETLPRLIDFAIQFAWGLYYAHSQGLVHQDVKSANVLITRSGIVKVTDFGLSKAREAASLATESGRDSGHASRGTTAYCSPEQARREELTHASDIWSWAVAILEMFVGDVTWMAGQAADRALETYLELGPEEECIPPMPKSLADLLRHCLQQRPENRPANMGEVIDGLKTTFKETAGEDYPRPAPASEAMTADRLNNRAVSVLDLGKQAEADRLWAMALQAEPGHPEATYNRALSEWRQGRLSDVTAVQVLNGIRAHRRGPLLLNYLLAQAQLERGDIHAAVKVLEEIDAESIAGHNIAGTIAVARQRLPLSRRLVRVFGAQKGPIRTVSMSWDGCFVLSGGGTTSGPFELRFWEIRSGSCICAFEGHTAPVTCTCFSADGLSILSGSADGILRRWEPSSGQCIFAQHAHAGVIHAVCMTGDGRKILSAGADGAIRVWDTLSGECIHALPGHAGAIHAMCLCGYGSYALSAGQDGLLRLWEVDSGQCVRVFTDRDTPLTAVYASINEQVGLTGDARGRLTLWNMRTGEAMRSIQAHSSPVRGIYMSGNMRYAVSASGKGKLRLWEVPADRCVCTFDAAAPFSVMGDARYLVTGGKDGLLRLWSIRCDVAPRAAAMMLCQAVGTA